MDRDREAQSWWVSQCGAPRAPHARGALGWAGTPPTARGQRPLGDRTADETVQGAELGEECKPLVGQTTPTFPGSSPSLILMAKSFL